VNEKARRPLCPVFNRDYGGYKLSSFECEPCRVSYTRAAYDDPQPEGDASRAQKNT
jgi:hypothetical protein